MELKPSTAPVAEPIGDVPPAQKRLGGMIAKWQLDTDLIASFADNVGKGALERACTDVYGQSGTAVLEALIAVHDFVPEIGDVWDDLPHTVVDAVV